MPSLSPFVGEVSASSVHVMTLNARRRMPDLWPRRADHWNTRRPLFQRLLDEERPGILGLQEVLPAQSRDIAAMLGRGYASVGSGRERHGGGERLELHVDVSRFQIIGSRAWWLSGTPDAPGSRSFGNLIPRFVLQAQVRQLETGAQVEAFVTHLDHLSARSRQASARLLTDRVSTIVGPTVVMGDFNTDAGTATHRALTGRGQLVDALDAAVQRLSPGWGTFSSYRPPRVGTRRLDWILVDPAARVEAAGVNAARWNGAAASDHDPVEAVVSWGRNDIKGAR